MARIIAVANQKGGVGKTTTVVNIGALFADKGYRTLMVDLDPQAAMTSAYGIDPNTLKKSVYHVLLAQELDAANAIIKDYRPNLDILPTNLDLAGAEVELISLIGREYLLKEALATVQDTYDFILIDCGPSLGLLTINALTSADEVLVPLLCEFLALRGMGILFDTIRRVRDRTNPRLAVLGIVVTMYDARSLHSREVLAEVQSMFGDYLFSTPIRQSVRFADSSAAQMPMIDYDSDHIGTEAYRMLVEEILDETA